MATHKHNYILVREVVKVVKGKTVTYRFYECAEPNCPKPNKMKASLCLSRIRSRVSRADLSTNTAGYSKRLSMVCTTTNVSAAP
jgi:hypothetical protein